MSETRQPRIYVIDDDPRMLSAAARLLPKWGFGCIVYSDPRLALRAIESDPPDLVIVDIYMPELDGFTVMAKLHELTPDTPVIAVSGEVVCGENVPVLRMSSYLGADAALSKPVDPELLRAEITRLLSPASGDSGPPPG